MTAEPQRLFLIELSDEEYKVVTKNEVDEINQSAIEFDGFLGCHIIKELSDQEKIIAEAYLKQKVSEITDERIEREGFSDVIALAGKQLSFQEGAKWFKEKLLNSK